MIYKKGKLYKIEWEDAEGSTGWTYPSTALEWKTPRVITYGVFIGYNKTKDPLFASSFDTQNELYNGISTRPRGMIRKSTLLKG